jgi:hypothetical protein
VRDILDNRLLSDTQEPITQTSGHDAGSPIHPEEIRASVDFRIGNSVSLKRTVRTTPAGLVTAGIMVAGIVLSITALVRRFDDPADFTEGIIRGF